MDNSTVLFYVGVSILAFLMMLPFLYVVFRVVSAAVFRSWWEIRSVFADGDSEKDSNKEVES